MIPIRSIIFPKEQPETLIGKTHRINTGLGRLHITVNQYEGKPYEVFAVMGKAGQDVTADTESLGRLISLALQNGISIDDISKQLNGIGGNTQYIGKRGTVKSIPDAIGKVLKEYCNTETKTQWEETEYDLCPSCGNSLIYQEGCEHCECGYSRC